MNRCPRPKHVCGSFHRTGWSRRVLEPLALGVPLSSRHCCCSSCPSQRNSAVVVAFSCALRARSAPCIALLRHINSSFRVWWCFSCWNVVIVVVVAETATYCFAEYGTFLLHIGVAGFLWVGGCHASFVVTSAADIVSLTLVKFVSARSPPRERLPGVV